MSKAKIAAKSNIDHQNSFAEVEVSNQPELFTESQHATTAKKSSTKTKPENRPSQISQNQEDADHQSPIFIIDDDPLIADCIKLAAQQGLKNLAQKATARISQKAALQDSMSQKLRTESAQKNPATRAQKSPTSQNSREEPTAAQNSYSSPTPEQSSLLPKIEIFSDALAAINATSSRVPALIFLDVLLTGPNGFTLLNELASYPETADIPIVLVSSLDLSNYPLKHYNIVRVLSKETMLPAAITTLVEEYYA